MADDPERPDLTAETLDRIRGRTVANMNLGVAPTDPLYLDATQGSIANDLSTPNALELDGFYSTVEIAARANVPAGAFGELADDWAESVGLERKGVSYADGVETFTGTEGAEIPAGVTITTRAVQGADPIAFQTTAGGTIPAGGYLDLPIRAVLPGSAGNVAAGSILEPAVEIVGVTGYTNDAATSSGADVESDERLVGRVQDALGSPQGFGNAASIRALLLARPGVGYAVVVPAARGAGTADIYLTDEQNNPLSTQAIADHQAWGDPGTPRGQGLGEFPVNQDWLVKTPAITAVSVAAKLILGDGYSLDGAGGTIAVRPRLDKAITGYIGGLPVGADVQRNRVIQAIMGVPGVVDVVTSGTGALAVGGNTTTDFAIAADHVASPQPPTYTTA